MNLPTKYANYKDRKIDLNKPVKIYRNLNRRGVVYSVLQKLGQYQLVVAHATCLNLKNCKFIVNEKSRDRIRKTDKKEVHAFIEGQIENIVGYTPDKVFYDPRKVDGFILVNTNQLVIKAQRVNCNEKGVFAQL